MNTTYLLVAACIGVITMIVSIVALRQISTFGRAATPIGVCCGLLTLAGISDLVKSWNTGLLIPWVTLAVTVVLLLLLKFIARLWNCFTQAKQYTDGYSRKKWEKPKKKPFAKCGLPSDTFNPPIGTLRD
jgi:hypothetical protein